MSTRKIKDAFDDTTQELIYFKGHARATYMSDGTNVEDAINAKQSSIADLETIRSGAEKGATALQEVPEGYVKEAALQTALKDKVDKVDGKGLSTEDFTTALKAKLDSLKNYDDTAIQNAVSGLQTQLDTLVEGNASAAIESFNEIIAFLDGIQDTQDLSSIIASIEQQIAGKMENITLATVATSGSYNDLQDKPTIPDISGGEVYITPFTAMQFHTGWVELTDEQLNELINAASQNKIIGMPHGGNYQAGYIIADYKYGLSESDDTFWSLDLGVIYNGAHYSNYITSNSGPYFRGTLLNITSFSSFIDSVTVEDGVATVSDVNGYPDNCIFWVVGECTELYIGFEPSEIGKTVRFFTGENCTLEIAYPVYWPNGEVPTIEPYTHYELSLVTNMDGAFNAVLTPFKQVE